MKAIILDMYGVIVQDTGDGFYEYVNQTFPELPVKEMQQQWLKASVGDCTSMELLENFGYTGDLKKIEKDYLDTVEVMEGFYEFASEMKKNYKLALITNDLSEWSHYLRDKHRLNEHFEVIAVSGDLKMKKPDARIFQHTLEKLGCTASDCVYIDDRRRNLEAARELGMDTVLFNSRNVEFEGKCVLSYKELADVLAKNSVTEDETWTINIK